MNKYELGFIGAGNMAEGIVGGVVAAKVVGASQIIAADPVPERRQLFANRFSVTVTEDNRAVVAGSRCVVLAVKPQQFADVVAPIADAFTSDHVIVSIMAGLGTAKIAKTIGGSSLRIVRVMPNLPIRVGAGVAGIVAGEHATSDDVRFVKSLFEAGGQAVVLDDEALMDAVTAVSGSGPAYFYYFVEAITAGGVAAGLSREDALKLAENTCLGAARMMLETGEEPAELRRKVTSKGGTTQAALEHMESQGVAKHIEQAVQAAARRSKELGA